MRCRERKHVPRTTACSQTTAPPWRAQGGPELSQGAGPVLLQLPEGAQAIPGTRTAVKGLGLTQAYVLDTGETSPSTRKDQRVSSTAARRGMVKTQSQIRLSAQTPAMRKKNLLIYF